jgi:hypothetical protein
MGKRKPSIIGKKLRGEWAEMRFLVCATEHGLQVSKPWGDSRSYDFVVGRPGHFVAVQVKSTIFELEEGWMCTVCSCNHPYPPGSFDFLAAYVVFEDMWYIIPEKKIVGMKSISLHTKCSQSKYEGYRDGWELLQREIDPTSGHIDSIQGCAEEFSSDGLNGNLIDEGNEERGSLGVRDCPGFSSGFHREVSTSTVSAQGRNSFLLRVATLCRRVSSAHT